VLRAVARLGAHRRDGERRERVEPGQDLRVDRALGGGAQETAAWVGRTVSHVGVLVTTNFLFFFAFVVYFTTIWAGRFSCFFSFLSDWVVLRDHRSRVVIYFCFTFCHTHVSTISVACFVIDTFRV
jgi:hypothetical protein